MLIAVVAGGQSWGSINPGALLKGLGGRESAAVYLAECWSEMGHEVHVFAAQDDGSKHYVKDNGVSRYLPTDMAVPMMANLPYDFILAWEEPTFFGFEEIVEQGALRLCGMQVAHLPHVEPEHYDNVDCWVALSPWAADFLYSQSDRLRDMKVQPNCVWIDRYQARCNGKVRETGRQFLYASSPDRGLAHLLRSWPKFREAFPGCELHVAYGIEHLVANKWMHNLVGEMALDIEQLIEQEGIVYHGRIGQDVLAGLHAACDALLFPCDPIAPTETGCITVIEALASGNIPFITDADCLPSEFGDKGAVVIPLPWDADKFIAQVKKVLGDEDEVARLRRWGRRFGSQRDWRKVAVSWLEMVDGLLADREKTLAVSGPQQ